MGLKRGISDDDGFAKQGAAFGAADIKHIGQFGEGGQGEVAHFGGQGVAEACAIHKQRQAVATAHLRERGKFGLAVCRAKLGGLRNVYHAGLDDVLFNRAGGVVLFDEVLHLLRVELAVGSGQGEHFVAGGFDGTGFVGGDVAGFGSDNALVRPQDMGDYSCIGLRAAH